MGSDLNNGDMNPNDLQIQIKEELKSLVIHSLDQYKKMMTQMTQNGAFTANEMELMHQKCTSCIEKAFQLSFSNLRSTKNPDPSIESLYQKQLNYLKNKIKHELTTCVRRHEIILEESTKKANNCTASAECFYEDEMEKLNSKSIKNLEEAHGRHREMAVKKFQDSCRQVGLDPSVWEFDLLERLAERLQDSLEELEDKPDPSAESEMVPFDVLSLEGATSIKKSYTSDDQQKETCVLVNDPSPDLKYSPNSQLASPPYSGSPGNHRGHNKPQVHDMKPVIKQDVTFYPQASPRANKLKVKQDDGKLNNLQAEEFLQFHNDKPLEHQPVLARAFPDTPNKIKQEPQEQPKQNHDYHNLQFKTPDIVVDASIRNNSHEHLKSSSSNAPSKPELLHLGIMLNEEKITVSTYNFRNSGGIQILFPDQLASVRVLGDQVVFGEQPPKGKIDGVAYFKLWTLLTAPPDERYKIDLNGNSLSLCNEEILAVYFAHIKNKSEKMMSGTLSRVVLALQFVTSSNQKERIRDASKLAKFPHIKIISSTMAALVAESRKISLETPKPSWVVEYDSNYLNISFVEISRHSVTVRASFRSRWNKKLLGVLLDSVNKVEFYSRQKEVVGHFYEKVISTFSKNSCCSLCEQLIVIEGTNPRLNEYLIHKWPHSTKTLMEATSFRKGAPYLASFDDTKIFKMSDLSFGDCGRWGWSKLGLYYSASCAYFSHKVESDLVFEYPITISTAGSNQVVELRERFTKKDKVKEMSVCAYSMTLTSAKKCTVIAVCRMDPNGIYSLTFKPQEGVTSYRIFRALVDTNGRDDFITLVRIINKSF